MSPRFAWLLPCALLCGCTDPEDDPVVDASPPADVATPTAGPDGAAATAAPFSIVVLPDTQFYAQAYPEIFRAQTDWILEHRASDRIAFVVHEGDIVNFDFPEQWAVASQSLHMLDGKVPYVLATGNHDLSWKGGRLSRDADLLNRHFPASALAALPWPTGTFEPGKMENHYQVLDAFGTRWLVLSLEHGPRDAVVAWADDLLGKYADLPAIVVTHAYLSDIFGRYNRTNLQPFWPCNDRMDLGGCNDGEDLWQKVISRHDNVVFVFSGHVLHPGVGRLTSEHPSGRRTHQMLANYQMCADLPCINRTTGQPTRGGDGFMRLVRVDPAARTATVETFSPYLNEKMIDPAQTFVLPLDPLPVPPPITTARAPLSRAQERVPARGCDGVQVVLQGVEATGTETSAHSLRACLGDACETFTIDPNSLRCLPARAQSRITCANDEGRLRLFFWQGLSARQRIAVTAEGAAGPVYAARQMVPARRAGKCWTAVHRLDR